jgi:hypothetical protein
MDLVKFSYTIRISSYIRILTTAYTTIHTATTYMIQKCHLPFIHSYSLRLLSYILPACSYSCNCMFSHLMTAPSCTHSYVLPAYDHSPIRSYVLTACNHSPTRSYVPAYDHSTRSYVLPACNHSPTRSYVLTACNHSLTRSYVPAYDHSPMSSYVLPACNHSPTRSYVLPACNYSHTFFQLAATHAIVCSPTS